MTSYFLKTTKLLNTVALRLTARSETSYLQAHINGRELSHSYLVLSELQEKKDSGNYSVAHRMNAVVRRENPFAGL